MLSPFSPFTLSRNISYSISYSHTQSLVYIWSFNVMLRERERERERELFVCAAQGRGWSTQSGPTKEKFKLSNKNILLILLKANGWALFVLTYLGSFEFPALFLNQTGFHSDRRFSFKKIKWMFLVWSLLLLQSWSDWKTTPSRERRLKDVMGSNLVTCSLFLGIIPPLCFGNQPFMSLPFV